MGKMKEGKRFEEDIKRSAGDLFYLRFKDAGGWAKSQGLRFTSKNLCDCIIFTGYKMYLVENKSHLGKSFPRTELGQLEGLLEISYLNVVPCFFLNFRDLAETYLLTAEQVDDSMRDRESVSLAYCQEHGILIPQKLKRVRYAYDLSVL